MPRLRYRLDKLAAPQLASPERPDLSGLTDDELRERYDRLVSGIPPTPELDALPLPELVARYRALARA